MEGEKERRERDRIARKNEVKKWKDAKEKVSCRKSRRTSHSVII